MQLSIDDLLELLDRAKGGSRDEALAGLGEPDAMIIAEDAPEDEGDDSGSLEALMASMAGEDEAPEEDEEDTGEKFPSFAAMRKAKGGIVR